MTHGPAELRAAATRLDGKVVVANIAALHDHPDEATARHLEGHAQDLALGAAALRAQAAIIEHAEALISTKPAGSLKLYALGANDALSDVLRIARAELDADVTARTARESKTKELA